MAVDSGTYTPETVERNRRIADQLLMQSLKPREIRHWSQGLGQMGEAAINGYLGYQADQEAKAGEKAQTEALAKLLNGDNTAPAATPMSAPAQAPAASPDFAQRIAGIESGGDYNALGPETKGDRAYGKYQVMGANVGPWTKAHLGQEMTPEQFLANPQAQDAVFKGQFGQYANKYGPEGAARAWFAGEGGMNNPNARDVLGTSVADYAKKFNGANPVAAALTQPTQVAQSAGSDPKARIAAMLNDPSPFVRQLGSKLAQTVVQKQIEGEKPTDDIRDYEYAKRQGFQGTLTDFIQRKRAGAGEYGLQGIPGVDKNGNPVMIQLGKSGQAIQSQLPGGVTISKEPIKLDAGTSFILLDPITRQRIGEIPKDVAGKEAAEERGKAQGQAQVNEETSLAKSQLALDTIRKIREHPGREGLGATGLSATIPILGSGLPNTEARGFVNLVEQAKGQTFLQAFETLRGGGAITEAEGQKATQALARLDRAQRKEDFDAALKDLEDVVKSGMERTKNKARGLLPTNSAPTVVQPQQNDPLGLR